MRWCRAGSNSAGNAPDCTRVVGGLFTGVPVASPRARRRTYSASRDRLAGRSAAADQKPPRVRRLAHRQRARASGRASSSRCSSHAQSRRRSAQESGRSAADSDVPVVHTIHDYYLLCPRVTLTRRDATPCRPSPLLCGFRSHRLARWAPAVSHVIGCSQYVLDVHAHLFPAAELHVLRNPVELPTRVRATAAGGALSARVYRHPRPRQGGPPAPGSPAPSGVARVQPAAGRRRAAQGRGRRGRPSRTMGCAGKGI